MFANSICKTTVLFFTLTFTRATIISPAIERRTPIAMSDITNTTTDGSIFGNARFTFYNVGLGTCGQVNVATDFVAALNAPQYGSAPVSPSCFKTITVMWGGKSTQATIVDDCTACSFAGLDFSVGLFEFFASPDVGALEGGEWFFND